MAIPLAIVVWLVGSVDQEQFHRLWTRPKNWAMLAAGFGMTLAAVGLSFVRWYVLVRALDLPFRLADAFRLGFLGYLMNFIGIGSVGGDLFKALFIAHEQPGCRTEAVATVAVDRVVGLYATLLVASVAILASGTFFNDSLLGAICRFTLLATAVALSGVPLVLLPRFSGSRSFRAVVRLPGVGPVFERLVLAVEVYRRRWGRVALAGLLAMGVHASLPLAIWLLADALFEQAPTLGEHYVIVPLALVAGGVPFTPGGLGTFEFAMQELYRLVPMPGRDFGVLVALAYRLSTILVAAVGMVYYWFSRREIRQVLKGEG